MIFENQLRLFRPVAGFTFIALASGEAAVITQTNSQNGTGDVWNATTAWGGTAPSGINDYVTNPTATGSFAATATGLGTTVTSRVRNGTTGTFGGASLKIVAGTELLVRNATSHTGNLILDGGTIRSVSSVTFAGTLTTTTTTGVLGLGSANILTINSAVTGSGTFYLRSSDGTPTIRFGGSLVSAFAGFTGTLEIGGGPSVGVVTVDFDQNYTIAGALVMGNGSAADVLNLDQAITVNSFQFGAMSLTPNTYTASQLNTLFGNGAQFTGAGTLRVVPEPGVALFGVLGSLLVFTRRRLL